MSATALSTKELALKLGSVKKLSASDVTLKPTSIHGQPLSYLVVLDFEATCWDCNAKAPGKHEIIEFPAVILDVKTGKVIEEFQKYVRPSENPILSDFCKELTGITQDQVDSSLSLRQCLKECESWMTGCVERLGAVFYDHANFKYRTFVQSGSDASKSTLPKIAAFVTWSDWDLGQCLQRECARKLIHKPREFNSWVDLRYFYRNYYKRNPNGLTDALENVGLKFEGRAHSGIVDSRNTAKLATHMMKEGCVLKISRNIESSGRRVHTVPPPSSMGAILDRMRYADEKVKSKETGENAAKRIRTDNIT